MTTANADEMHKKECTGVEIKVPWGHISGKWWGSQDSRPILALHGWQDNAGTFDTLIPLLSSHIGVLAIDLPGHGFSSRLPDGVMYSIADYVYVVLMLMKDYNWEQVSILGHSMGSTIGFLMAGIFPEKVDLLIGIDSYKPLNFAERNYGAVMRHVLSMFLTADERNRSDSEPPSYPYDECVEKLYVGASTSIDRDKCPYILARNIRKSIKYPDKYFFARDSRIKYMNLGVWPHLMYNQMLSNIKCPTMYIRALNSPIVDDIKRFEAHMWTLKENPLFTYDEVQGRHHVHLNEPQKVSGIVNTFLSKYRQYNENLKSKL